MVPEAEQTKTASPSPAEILTVEEAADWLRVSVNTIRDSLKRGQLPGNKVGREWRLSRQAILDYLAIAAPEEYRDLPRPKQHG